MLYPLLDEAALSSIATAVARRPLLEGYPEKRLFLNTPGFRAGTHLFVPDGAWHTSRPQKRLKTHPSLMDADVPSAANSRVTPVLSRRWSEEGLLLDQYGRPIIPYWGQLLADRRIGLNTGLGHFYRYGNNQVVIGFVYRIYNNKLEVLLVLRKKEREWSLPCGFKDRSDANAQTAILREIKEETSLNCSGARFTLVLDRLHVGQMTTLHAWASNYLMIVHANQEYLLDTVPQANDDAIDAKWVDINTAMQIVRFSAHLSYLRQCLQELAH